MREIKFRYWNTIIGQMANNPKMPYKEDWTIKQLFSDRGWVWMQYTGLIDMNKTEVYEGDILKITNPFTRRSVLKEVHWNGETARFNGIPTSLTNVFEVIGNIYENPELVARGARNAPNTASTKETE